MNFKSIVALILLSLFIIVCIQNVEIIPINFLAWEWDISKLLLIIITLLAGIIIGMIIPGLLNSSNKKIIKEK